MLSRREAGPDTLAEGVVKWNHDLRRGLTWTGVVVVVVVSNDVGPSAVLGLAPDGPASALVIVVGKSVVEYLVENVHLAVE